MSAKLMLYDVLINIFVGVAVLVVVAFIFWAIQAFFRRKQQQHVYNALLAHTADQPGKDFASTQDVAKWTNLPETRVEQLCAINKKIFRWYDHRGQVKWGVYRAEPRSVYEERGLLFI